MSDIKSKYPPGWGTHAAAAKPTPATSTIKPPPCDRVRFDTAAVSDNPARFSAALGIRFEHADSDEDPDVLALTLHNITRMAAQA